MNLRSVARTGIGPAFLVTAMLAAFACGPAEPPKQASDRGPPDPLSSDSSGGNAYAAGRPGKDPAYNPGGNGTIVKGRPGDAPQVPTLAAFMENLHWGMSHAELTKVMTQTDGVIWKDYDEKLAKARVGPEQTSREAERESVKSAFNRSYIEFNATPTGYDSTGINKEYTYNNKEALMWIERKGKRRYYFFIQDKLWKMYDQYTLTDGGPMGGSYQEAVAKLNAQLNATGAASSSRTTRASTSRPPTGVTARASFARSTGAASKSSASRSPTSRSSRTSPRSARTRPPIRTSSIRRSSRSRRATAPTRTRRTHPRRPAPAKRARRPKRSRTANATTFVGLRATPARGLLDFAGPFGDVPAGRQLDGRFWRDAANGRLEQALARHRRTGAAGARPCKVHVHVLRRDTDEVDLASVRLDEWDCELGQRLHHLFDHLLVHASTHRT